MLIGPLFDCDAKLDNFCFYFLIWHFIYMPHVFITAAFLTWQILALVLEHEWRHPHLIGFIALERECCK
jgi:hypothetical protein